MRTPFAKAATRAAVKMARQGARIQPPSANGARRWVVLGLFVAVAVGFIGRAAWLQTARKDFLRDQGETRYMRQVAISAHRGSITDRHGQALAISTPVQSVSAVPRTLASERDRWPELVRLLSMNMEDLHRLVAERIDRKFVYLRRHVKPDVAAAVRKLGLKSVSLQREYRRYYPAAEVAAHVLGFTDIDDRGREGVELAFDDWLRGIDGAKLVIRDLHKRHVRDVASVRKVRPGRDLALSLDLRIQTLAYRALKGAVKQRGARAGSVVVLDARTGEILAMVNQPSYNPNKWVERAGAATRNRAVTDVIEPGSTMKPFTVAAALEARVLHPDSPIDTTPGFIKVGRHVIRDDPSHGRINVAGVLRRSSNVGASKIALATPPEHLWAVVSGVGFGAITASAYPGESAGILTRSPGWPALDRATLAFGYGLSVTPLQLARAYLVFANGGRFMPVTLERKAPDDSQIDPPRQVVSRSVADHVLRMMESVVSADGSGKRAQLLAYRAAGKTGTARKSTRGGYSDTRHTAIFAGMAPASDPRIVMVVVIDEPKGKEYYGGQVAAPVFAEVVAGSLRLMRVPPDDPDAIKHRIDLTQAILQPYSRQISPSPSPLESSNERRAG